MAQNIDIGFALTDFALANPIQFAQAVGLNHVQASRAALAYRDRLEAAQAQLNATAKQTQNPTKPVAAKEPDAKPTPSSE